jgi:hypothetical protein
VVESRVNWIFSHISLISQSGEIMARYLDIAKRMMKELEGKRTTADPSPVEAPLVPSEIIGWPIERQELWAERAAISEVDAGLPRDAAEQTALDLCRPAPPSAHEPLEVGDLCPRCQHEGRISHLYVRREGRLWCRRCLRKGGDELG